MRICLAQLDSTLGDIEANLEQARKAVAQAVERKADLVVFPELFLTGYSIGEVDEDLSMRADDPRLQRLAGDMGDVGVLVGFVESSPAGTNDYNSVAYYEGSRLVHVHRKLYLPAYAPFEERNSFTPGGTLRAFPVGSTRMAVLLCNDAWQPPLAFLATQDGSQVLLVPAASAQSTFPDRYDSEEYWHDITRFYGRMFQQFVVFVNRVGVEGRWRFWGGSHVIDPWGNLIAHAEHDRELILTVDLDLDDVRRRRRRVPLVKEARLSLLHREIGRLMNERGDL